MNKITGTIITLNEELHITDCVKNMFRVCDEVIVVDSMSQDKTAELAKQAGARVYYQPYLGDGPQKKYAEQLASYEWILNLDADERLDSSTIDYINSIDLSLVDHEAFALRRKNYVGKHQIKAAGFYPDYVVRLYNREKVSYLPYKRHAYVGTESAHQLSHHILHYTYLSYSDWVRRINALSDIDAGFMYEEGVKVYKWKPATHALIAGIRKFLFKGGLFQGLDGITVSITTVFATYLKYLKLQEIYDRQNSDYSDLQIPD